jgi:hypothetical protein
MEGLPSRGVVLACVLITLLILFVLRYVLGSGVFSFTINLGGTGMGTLGGGDLAEKADALVASHFTANYGGDPARLPDVIGALMGPLEQLFATRGARIDRKQLKTVILVAAVRHKVAGLDELRSALDLVP